MSSLYPGAVDSFSTKVDNVDKYMAAHMNDVQNAIVAVQGELGVNPAGPSLTVAALLESLVTGWVPESDTWVYVAADQFKIVGKDVTARFPVGVKLKCTNGGVTKYFYGISAVMSGSDTLVTITGGSDYSLSSGAITGNYYSYADAPQAFPQWFNYAVSWTAATTNPSIGDGTLTSVFSITGRICKIVIFIQTGTTTTFGTGEWRFSSPVARVGNDPLGNILMLDVGNGWVQGMARMSGSTTIVGYAITGTYSSNVQSTVPFTWANGGDRIYLDISYRI